MWMAKPLQRPSRPASAGKSRPAKTGATKGGKGSRDRDPAKWLHHSLKTIHKALKQAKKFEVRKVTRRLAQARKAADDQSKPTGPDATIKLEQQLQAAKQADLDMLAQQAAAKAGLGVGKSSNAPAAAAASVQASSTVASAVHQRLISASCVQKQITEQLNEFRRRFGSVQQQQQQKPQHLAPPADADVDAAADSDADSDGEEAAAVEALEPRSKRQKKSSLASPPTAAVAAAAANGHADHAAIPSSSGDSGAIASDAEFSSLSSDVPVIGEPVSADGSDDDDNSGNSIDLEAEYEAQLLQQQQPQQDGDQPPDDTELDDATLAALDKLRNRFKAAAAAANDGSESDDSGVISDTDDTNMSDSDSDPQQQRQQPKQQQQSGAAKYPPPPQLSKAEKLQLKKRQKLEKLLKRGKRVGQRMRRQLYEKLYGRDANHLKAHPQQSSHRGPSRHEQPTTTAGARVAGASRGSIGKDRQQQRAANRQQQQQQQRDSRKVDSGGKQQQEDLHPSWAARKQQQKQASAVAAAAPRKVVFGDNGETVVQSNAPQQQQQSHNMPQQQQQHQQPDFAGQQRGQQRGQQQSRHKGTTTLQQQVGRGFKVVKPSVSAGGPTEKLHPSWQAKKQQQAVIVAQPTGKKTVFDDE